MENSKPFKTLNQQLKILRNRGLADVDSNSKRSLEQIGYYSLINGYKRMFLARDSSGKIIHPEQFKQGASFKEIQALYDFDFELRSILYEALLKYETMLGAAIAYRFSEVHQEEHAYLAIDNFSRDPSNVPSVVGTISSLSSAIKKRSSQSKDNAIKHYVSNHGHVPLWVLVNFLTFGELNHFYSNCTHDIQLQIATDFKNSKEKSYGQIKQAAITPKAVMKINQMVNLFRNSVAHGEITYSKKITKNPDMGDVKAAANLPDLKINSQGGVFELILCLKAVLPYRTYQKLYRNVVNLLRDYKQSFNATDFKALLQDMNFPDEYELILRPKPDRR